MYIFCFQQFSWYIILCLFYDDVRIIITVHVCMVKLVPVLSSHCYGVAVSVTFKIGFENLLVFKISSNKWMDGDKIN